MRLVHLLISIFSLSLRRELAHRGNLFFQLLMTATGMASGLAVLAVVYGQIESLAGWSQPEALVLFATYQISSGFLATFIEPNLAWFNNQVRSGKLDEILLKPAPSLLLASLGSCAPLGLSQVVLGLVVLAGGLRVYHLPWTVGSLGGWCLMLLVGLVMIWASRLLLAVVVFWVPQVELDVLYSALWQCGRYPVQIYQQPIRFALTYILPLAYIATMPAYVLTHGQDLLGRCLVGLLLAGGLVGVVWGLWQAGLRRYSSATS